MKFSPRKILLLLILITISVIYLYGDLFPNEDYFYPRVELTHNLDYKLLISPKDCDVRVDLLILVLSVVENGDKRQSIRDTWGSVARKGKWPSQAFKYSVKLVFLFGSYQNFNQRHQLDTETKKYGDVLQINGSESYRIPTDKILMAFRWMEEKCPNVKYVMKTDDDVFVNLPVVMARLESEKGAFLFGDKLILANTHRSGKHGVSYSEYPFYFYPPYLIGYAYFMSSYVARKLLHASFHAPYLTFEDVYITGILAKSTNTHLVQLHPSWLGAGKVIGKCDFLKNNLFAAADLDSTTILEVWETFVDISKCF